MIASPSREPCKNVGGDGFILSASIAFEPPLCGLLIRKDRDRQETLRNPFLFDLPPPLLWRFDLNPCAGC